MNGVIQVNKCNILLRSEEVNSYLYIFPNNKQVQKYTYTVFKYSDILHKVMDEMSISAIPTPLVSFLLISYFSTSLLKHLCQCLIEPFSRPDPTLSDLDWQTRTKNKPTKGVTFPSIFTTISNSTGVFFSVSVQIITTNSWGRKKNKPSTVLCLDAVTANQHPWTLFPRLTEQGFKETVFLVH